MKRALILILCLGLAGCQELGIGKGEVGSALGAGFGGYGGGWLGSQIGSGAGQTVATIAGASMGALFGSAIGRKLAEGDLNLIGQATQQTLTIDGQLERAKGVACRRPDGTWDVQPS
jgi:surface antigen